MRLWPATGLLLVLLALPSTSVGADGVVVTQYAFCSPPRFLVNTNTPPRSATQTIPLSRFGASLFVTTPDFQALINYSHGSFGFPPGQRAVRVSIRPDCHPPKLPTTATLKQDGNAYAFSFRYLPSGATVSHGRKLLLTLEYPHTPFEMVAFEHGVWRPICGQATLSLTPETATCPDNRLVQEVALLYYPHGSSSGTTRKPKPKSGGPPTILIVLIIGVVLTLAVAGFLLQIGRRPAGRAAARRRR